MEWVVGIQKAISASGALRLQLEKGESMEILLPMAMTDQQFTQEQWKRIDPGRSMWCWTTTRRRRGSGAD